MTTTLRKGIPVISLADGVKLGTIEHVYFDPMRKQIVGFSFQQDGGLFGGKTTGLVDVSDIHAFGPDAVTIDDLSGVHGQLAIDTQCNDLIELEDLLKREVLTEGGTHIGWVTALQFEQDSYRLTKIQVSPGFFPEERLIGSDELLHIGPELVLVSDAVCAPADQATESKPKQSPVRLIGPEREERRVAEAV